MRKDDLSILMGYNKLLEPFDKHKITKTSKVSIYPASKVSIYNKNPVWDEYDLCEVQISSTLGNILNAIYNNPIKEEGFCFYSIDVNGCLIHVGEYSYIYEHTGMRTTNITLYNTVNKNMWSGLYSHDSMYKTYVDIQTEDLPSLVNALYSQTSYSIILALIQECVREDSEFIRYLEQFKKYKFDKNINSAIEALSILSENLYYRIEDGSIPITFKNKLSDVINTPIALSSIKDYALNLIEDKIIITGDPDSQAMVLKELSEKFFHYPVWETESGIIVRYNQKTVKNQMIRYLNTKRIYNDDIIIYLIHDGNDEALKDISVFSSEGRIEFMIVDGEKMVDGTMIQHILQIKDSLTDDGLKKAIKDNKAYWATC